METTDSFDGSIESAIAGLLQPEEPVETEAVEEPDEVEETAEVEEVEEESDEDYEDDEDTEEAEEDSAPDIYTVKVDGKEEQVSLEDLKRGYSGQKYVQKGMQEAAAQRKQAEEVYAALLNERQQLAQVFQQVQSGLPQAPQEPSREMFESDPIGYMEAKLKFDDDVKSYNQQIGQLQQVVAQQSQAQQAAQHAYLQREMETLKQVVPEFSDPEKASKTRDRLMTMGQEVYGYDPSEISQVMDHRAIRVLNDAIKYQELMAGKTEKQSKPKARRTVKAGSKKTLSNEKSARQTRSKLKQSGSIDDALGLILNT